MTNMIKSGIKDCVSISDLGVLRRHLGVDYEFGSDHLGNYLRCSMDNYVASIVKDFTEEFNPTREFNTPGATGPPPTRSTKDDSIIEMEKFRSYVGRVMFASGKTEPTTSTACTAGNLVPT